MSKDWEKRIKEIEQRYNDEGFDDFMSWPVLNATMIISRVEPEVSSAIKGMIDVKVTPTIAYQLLHVKQWLDLGNDINDVSSVCEIGGGYGAMNHVWRLLGYTGDWYTLDYPIMMKLQAYYCDSVGIEPPIPVETVPANCDMLIACFSLSEMDIEERARAMKNANFNHHLIAYASKWDGVDNGEYFGNWGGEVILSPKFKTVYYHVR